jgi:hypothetical protein
MLKKEFLEKKAAKVAKKFGLTSEQVLEAQRAAHGIYEYVGGDLAPDNPRRGTCKRSTIVEVVLDAGRLEQDLKCRGKLTDQLAAALHGKDAEDLIGPAFPYLEYEVMGV